MYVCMYVCMYVFIFVYICVDICMQHQPAFSVFLIRLSNVVGISRDGYFIGRQESGGSGFEGRDEESAADLEATIPG